MIRKTLRNLLGSLAVVCVAAVAMGSSWGRSGGRGGVFGGLAIVAVGAGVFTLHAAFELVRFYRFGRGGFHATRAYELTLGADAVVFLRPLAVDERCIVYVRCSNPWTKILRVAPGAPAPPVTARLLRMLYDENKRHPVEAQFIMKSPAGWAGEIHLVVKHRILTPPGSGGNATIVEPIAPPETVTVEIVGRCNRAEFPETAEIIDVVQGFPLVASQQTAKSG